MTEFHLFAEIDKATAAYPKSCARCHAKFHALCRPIFFVNEYICASCKSEAMDVEYDDEAMDDPRRGQAAGLNRKFDWREP